MALDSGEKVVKLKEISGSVPYVPAKSKLSIAVDAFTPALKQLEKNALAVDQANWYNDFIEKTSAQYEIFSEEYKHDPNGMAASTKTYTDNLLNTVPKAFRVQAASILAHKNSAMIGTATNAYIGLQTDKALSGNLETMNNTAADNSAALSVIFNNDLDNAEAKISKINLETQNNSVARLNNDAHMSQILVDNGILDQKNHDIYLDQAIKSWTKNRLLAIMQSFDGEDEAFNYLQSWLNGEDLYPVKDQSNAIFVRANQNLKNYETREDIYTEVFTSFNNLRGKKIADLNKDKNFNLSFQKEFGMPMHFSNFANGANRNAALYIDKYYSTLKTTDKKKVLKELHSIYKITDAAALAMNDQKVTNLNADELEKMFEMIMFNHNIVDPESILSISDANYGKMKAIFAKQGVVPKIWKNYLSTAVGDISNPAVLNDVKKRVELYNDIKNDFGISQLKNTNELIKHIANGNFVSDNSIIAAAESFKTRDMKEITKHINQSVSQDAEKFNKMILHALDNNPSLLDNIFKPFRASVSRDLSLSTFFGDGNKYSKVLIPNNSTLGIQHKFTWFADEPGDVIPPAIQTEFLEMVKKKLINNAPNSSFDIYENDNKTITTAVFETLEELLAAGHSPSKYTEDGQIRLVKNAIEAEFNINGSALHWSAMNAVDAYYNTLPEDQKANAFGINSRTQTPYTLQEVKNFIIDTDSNIIYQPTNKTVNGKIGYKIIIKNPDGLKIKITDANEVWQPDGWDKNLKPDAPANKAELISYLALERKNIIDKWLGPHDPTDGNVEYLVKQLSHGIEKFKIKLSDFSWMVDIPLMDDLPKEWKPFKMLFDLASTNVPDLSEEGSKIETEIKKIKDALVYEEEINLNNKIDSQAKFAEGLFSPDKMPFQHYNDQTNFMHFVTKNWTDTTLPLTFRTNNYMAVKKIKGKWDGALDLKNEDNNAAVFAHPADSIRAGVIVMMNMSTIVNTKVLKQYGDVPTLKQILTHYAEDSKIYLSEATKAGFDINEGVNFQDQDQMHKLIKFMIRHEMGGEAFDKYYPKNNHMILDAYIQQGYRNGLNHFAGKFVN